MLSGDPRRVGLDIVKAGLNKSMLMHHLGLLSQISQVSIRVTLGVLRLEELLEHTSLGDLDGRLLGSALGNPLNVGLGLLEGDIVVEMTDELHNVASSVLLDLLQRDVVRDLEQTNGLSSSESEELLTGRLLKVASVNVQLSSEGDLSRSVVVLAKGHVELLKVVFGQVLNGHLDGVQHHHETGSGVLKVLSHIVLESRVLDIGLGSGDTESGHKVENGSGGNTSSSNGNQGEETGIVPASNMALSDQLGDLSLGKNGSGDVETAVLSLGRSVDVHSITQPLVRLSRQVELGGTQGVRDVLQRINQAVGEVVGRVDLPLVGSSVVGSVEHSVGHQIPHLGVGVVEILLHSQNSLSGLVGTVPHLSELRQVLLHGSVSPGRRHSLSSSSTLRDTSRSLHLLGGLVADKGTSALNELLSKVVQLLEVVRRVGDLVGLETQPLNGLSNGSEEPLLLSLGVGVVESQVALSVVELGVAKVDGDGLGVSDMEVSVRLRGESGEDLALGGLEMLHHSVHVGLGVLSDLVQVAEEASSEHGGGRHDRLIVLGLGSSSRLGLGSLLLDQVSLVLGSQQSLQLLVDHGLEVGRVGPLESRHLLDSHHDTRQRLVSLLLQSGLVGSNVGGNLSVHVITRHLNAHTSSLVQALSSVCVLGPLPGGIQLHVGFDPAVGNGLGDLVSLGHGGGGAVLGRRGQVVHQSSLFLVLTKSDGVENVVEGGGDLFVFEHLLDLGLGEAQMLQLGAQIGNVGHVVECTLSMKRSEWEVPHRLDW